MKRVLVPLAEGFEELEAVTIIDILRRAGLEVVVASLAGSPVTGSHGIRLAADTPLAALIEQDFDMIALPGGMPGAEHLKNDPRIAEFVRRLHDRGCPVAAICAAPMVLAAAGVLEGRRATSYPGFLADRGQVHRRRRCRGRGPRRHHLARARHGARLRAELVEELAGCGRAAGSRVAPRAREAGGRVTDAADKSGIAQAPRHMRREMVFTGRAREHRQEPDACGLARAARVALYALAASATQPWPRFLYGAVAAYALVVMAFRWRGFPVQDTGARIALGAAAMVAFITVVASRTGGTASPLANLYLLPIVVVAMTLGRRGALIVVRRRPARLALAARGRGRGAAAGASC